MLTATLHFEGLESGNVSFRACSKIINLSTGEYPSLIPLIQVYFVLMFHRRPTYSIPGAIGRACSRSMDSGPAVPRMILEIRSMYERWVEEPFGGQWEPVEEKCSVQDSH